MQPPGGGALSQPAGAPTHVSDVPFHAQTEQQCGPAALAMVLGWAGHPATPAALADQVMSPARDGSLQPSLISAARRAGHLAYPIQGEAALVQELRAGHPVVVMQNLGLGWLPAWHYAVAIGHDPGSVTLHSGVHQAMTMPLRTFRLTWQRADEWGLVVLPPGALPASADALGYAQALTGLERARPDLPLAPAWQAGAQRWPQAELMWVGLANAQLAAGARADARRSLEQAVEHAPAPAAAWNNLAQLRLEDGDAAGAAQAAQRAVDLGGPHADTAQTTLAAARQALAEEQKPCPCKGGAAAR